jgi:hypothetical protein
MFLFIRLWVIFTVLQIFEGHQKNWNGLHTACFTLVWHACCKQTNYEQNMHSLKIMGIYQALMVTSQWVRRWPAVIAILEPHENHEWRSALTGTGLCHQDKAFLQRAPLCFAKCAYTKGHPGDLYDGAFQPQQWTDPHHRMCRYIYTESCNALPAACKQKPTHHLLSWM